MATGDDSASYLQTLDLAITFESADTARVQITDAANERWTIPESLVPAGDFDSLGADEELQYELSFTNSTTELFTFTLVRKADGAVLFDSAEAFRFEDQYIELSTALPPTNHLFGVGEYSRSTGLPLVPGSSTTLWARDMAAANFDTNLYGSHPFYVSLSAEGKAHGAFLRNSNGMDVIYGANADSLTFKVIGGVVDLFVFAGPTPAMVAGLPPGTPPPPPKKHDLRHRPSSVSFDHAPHHNPTPYPSALPTTSTSCSANTATRPSARWRRSGRTTPRPRSRSIRYGWTSTTWRPGRTGLSTRPTFRRTRSLASLRLSTITASTLS